MNLPALAVRRPITWIMTSLAMGLFGFFTLSRLQLDLLPNIEFPVVAVITSWQGADPEGIEQLVTRPVEEALELVPGIERVTSTSSQGTSLVLAEFDWGSDMRDTEQDVRKQLELTALDRMPDDVDRPLVFAFDPSLSPVVFLAVNAPGSPAAVRALADETIAPRLARLPGVAAAEVMGGAEREIQVQLLPDWLKAYGISPSQVAMAVGAADAQSPGGLVEEGDQELGVVTKAELADVQDIRDVVIGATMGVPVRVSDVAEVVDGSAEVTNVVRADGKPAVMLAVRKQSDANTVQVSRAVNAELVELQEDLPEGVEVGMLFDQAEPITLSLSNLASTALISLVATALVLVSFLRNWRTSAIIAVSIPFSMLVTFAVMDALGVTLNIISMAGLALAVGMLVDNSIVVIEHIVVVLDRGRPLREAAIEGTNEVITPIVASTLTTLSVFVPVLFVPGIAGQMFRDMALTICISLLASLFVTVTLVPLLASLGLKLRTPYAWERMVGWLTAWVEPVSDAYDRHAAGIVSRPVRVLGAAVVVGVLVVATTPLLGVDFLPQNDRSMIEFTVKTAPGSSLQATRRVFRQLEDILAEAVPEARTASTEYGAGEGLIAILGNSSNQGTMRVSLVPPLSRDRTQQEIELDLKERFQAIPGVEVKPQGNPLITGGDVVVRIAMNDIEALRVYGSALALNLEGRPEVGAVEFDLAEARPELQVGLDRDQAQRLGLTAGEVASTIATTYMGLEVARLQDGEDEVPVRVRATRATRTDMDALRDVPVALPTGGTVPLSAVANIETGLGPAAIPRVDQERAGNVAVSLGDASLGELLGVIRTALREVPPPANATVTVEGAAEDLQESFEALAYAILVAILLVYMVMASQFESLAEPFVILSTIPLAVVGAILGLLLTVTTVQVTALIGVVLLVGIVVNNGILLIDVLKRNRERGEDLVLAAGAAGRSRMRPILMTSITTILAMLPLALEIGQGAELWAPMARAVIGGMTVSTLLTLLVVPATYVLITRIIDRARRS